MTNRQALTAYTTICRLGQRASGKAAFALFRLKRQLKEVVDFQGEEQEKLVAQCGGKIAETGLILIDDEEQQKRFREMDDELGRMEVDLQPIELPENSVPDITLAEIEALEGVVNFI